MADSVATDESEQQENVSDERFEEQVLPRISYSLVHYDGQY